MISRIIEFSVRVISLSLRLRLITPTSTSIILDITKTSSNNCLWSAGVIASIIILGRLYMFVFIWLCVTFSASLCQRRPNVSPPQQFFSRPLWPWRFFNVWTLLFYYFGDVKSILTRSAVVVAIYLCYLKTCFFVSNKGERKTLEDQPKRCVWPDIRKLKQTTKTTATRASLNTERFIEQNSSCARAL